MSYLRMGAILGDRLSLVISGSCISLILWKIFS